MPTIYGALGLADTDYVFNATTGQRAIYDVTAEYVARYREDLASSTRIFVGGMTSDHTLRYSLPGSGRMQKRRESGRPGAVKFTGYWDIGLPLEDFADAITMDDVTRAYMTAAELQRQVDTIISRNVNTRRFELMKALLNNTARTFVDPLRGSLTIQPLANGDTVQYPPVLGSETAATDDHYLESGYAASAISDTNDPYITIANELEEHFGAPTGGSEIAVFINNAQTAKTVALTDFIPVTALGVMPGTDTATVTSVPPQLAAIRTARVLGRHEGAGVWVVEWRYVPSAYMIGVHLGAPAPLLERMDPADTGLGSGLQLVADENEFPLETSIWRDRFGYGAGNRLNGVVMELGSGGTYGIPSGYS